MADQNEVKEVAESAAAAATAGAAWLQTRAILRVIFIILLVAALLWMLYALEGVILLLILAIFFAYLIAPLVEFVQRPFKLGGRERVIPRGVAIGIVYLIIFGAVGITFYILVPRVGTQLTEFAKQSPTYLTNARGRVEVLRKFYASHEIPAAVGDEITKAVSRAIDVAAGYIKVGVEAIVGWLGYIPWLVLIPILSFFLLKDAESFRRSALLMLPSGRWRWRGDEFFQDVNSTLAAYIRAQLIACVLIGSICTLGFWIIGVPYWLALGVIAGFLEFIPLAGPLTVAVIAVLLTAGLHSITAALLVLLFLIVLRIAQDYVIYPRIIGQGIHLHPLAVILSILCGAELAGIAGIFLAIPVVAIATVSYRHWLEHRGSEGLVTDILKPVEEIAMAPATTGGPAPAATQPPSAPASKKPVAPQYHPTASTTPEQMARARPDLTTGELKLPQPD